MNNSDPNLSTEEKWTAWLDGKLSAEEAAAFEREHPEAAAERAMNDRIMNAVRLHSPAPKLRNADFFNERILREIAPTPTPAPAKKNALWPLWRLALAGAFCLLAVFGIYEKFVRGNEGGPGVDITQISPNGDADGQLAQVIELNPGDASLNATELDAGGLKVLWIDGLDQLPNDYALQ